MNTDEMVRALLDAYPDCTLRTSLGSFGGTHGRLPYVRVNLSRDDGAVVLSSDLRITFGEAIKDAYDRAVEDCWRAARPSLVRLRQLHVEEHQIASRAWDESST